MKINLMKPVENLYTNNKAIFNSILVYAACLYVSKKFGIRIPGVSSFVQDSAPSTDRIDTSSNNYKETNDPTVLPGCQSCYEQTVAAIWRSGIKSHSDFTKGECASKIANYIRSLGSVEDSLVRYAILAMTKISQTVKSDFTKGVIADEIVNLSKSVKIIKEEK